MCPYCLPTAHILSTVASLDVWVPFDMSHVLCLPDQVHRPSDLEDHSPWPETSGTTVRTQCAFYPSTLVASYRKDMLSWQPSFTEDRAKTLSPVEHGDRHGSPGQQREEGGQTR